MSPLPTRVRVLVIDDNHNGGESLGMLLREMGCAVYVTRGGLEAISAAPEFRPQLVITDINMPGLNGYETAERLKGQSWANSAVFVSCSGVAHGPDYPHYSPTRFHRHIAKPGRPGDFETILREVRSAGFEEDNSGVAGEGGGV